MTIYTLGYEKRNIDEFVMMLTAVGVEKLIDVREVAWSYKRDFSKTKFTNALADAGIEYIHVKSLGNPKIIRKSALTSVEILANYKVYLEETESGISTLIYIITLARQNEESICLTCFERSHTDCHRAIITEHIRPLVPAIEIVHL